MRADRRPSPDAPLPAVQFLAVSGGGENGAFGEGVLRGWSGHLMTGVSIGVLITEPTPSHVLLRRYLTAALDEVAGRCRRGRPPCQRPRFSVSGVN
jgi:hypothetical protein